MRKKLFTYFLIVIILSISISLVAMTVQNRQFYKDDMSATLQNIAYAMDKQIAPLSYPDFNALAISYSDMFSSSSQKIRVTIIDLEGKVIGESDFIPENMENHLKREEVQKAIKNGYGSSIRHSDTINMDFMYTAIYSDINQIVIRVSLPFNTITKVNRTLFNYTLLSAILGILASLILAFTLSRKFIKPLNAFSEVSLDIYKGNIGRKVEIKNSEKELSSLAFLFNLMTEKLKKTIDALTEENIKIVSIVDGMIDGLLFVDGNKKVLLINKRMKSFFDLDENRSYLNLDILDVVRNKKINEMINDSLENDNYFSTELKMPSAKKDIIYRVYTAPVRSEERSLPGVIVFLQDISEKRALEKMRSDFVSNVSHELKTPLTLIKGFIDTLKNGAIDDKNTALKFLNIIDIESERLTNLINDILSLAEIESGDLRTDLKEHDLKTLISDILSLLEPNAEKKNISLYNEINEKITIRTDKIKFSQLFINLIDNAIKYNTINGLVKITAVRSKGLIYISVEDNGIGIAEKYLDRIFERFYRIDNGRSKKENSTGLGLSISKHLARLLNGDIKVKSELEKGTIFTVTLPQ